MDSICQTVQRLTQTAVKAENKNGDLLIIYVYFLIDN